VHRLLETIPYRTPTPLCFRAGKMGQSLEGVTSLGSQN
jgi:hypothetical protein